MRSQVLTAAFLLLSSPALSAPAPGKDSDCDLIVKHGQSIQQAINKAKKGDKIIVEAGTYAEQLTITKDGIHLIGKGAILEPPAQLKNNFCTGLAVDFPPEQGGTNKEGDVGICIHGEGTELAPYQRELQHKKIAKQGAVIKDVVVSGFEVRKFLAANIAVIGGKDVRVTHNKLINGGQYGFLTVGSQNTLAAKNIVDHTESAGFIALCMDDKSDSKFKENNIFNYYIGLCTQTPGALMKWNDVKNCCFGPFVDPGIKGARIVENTISGHGTKCPPDAGAGIVIYGAQNTEVIRNTFKNINNIGTGKPTGTGVFITDAFGFVAQDNVFKQNTFKGNDFDIFVNTTAKNEFRGNDCNNALTLPQGLCGN